MNTGDREKYKTQIRDHTLDFLTNPMYHKKEFENDYASMSSMIKLPVPSNMFRPSMTFLQA
jgi:hypothetical protein